MSRDSKYYRYGTRRDTVEDDTALLSRARAVINRATGQLPPVPGGWDHQRLLTGGWDAGSYATAVRDADGRSDTLVKEVDCREVAYRHEEKKTRTRNRRRERRREERKSISDKPCRTILIKHLPSEVDELHLRGILQLFGSPIQDVRLVKHKDSGASRGFAFVEFQFLPDAQRWMEENQGSLVIGEWRASLTYSKSRGDEDWFCSQCGTQNFKRRSSCFKCDIQKNESEKYSQISTIPTRILLLMGLDSLTSEEKIQKELHDITAIDMNIQLIRDPATNAPRGLCYVALATVEFSSHLLEILSNMQPPFVIDGRSVTVHYCREGTEDDYVAWAEAEAVSSDFYEQYYQQTDPAGAGPYAASYASIDGSTPQQAQPEMSDADKVALAQEQVQAARKMQLEQQELTKKLLKKLRQGTGEKKHKKRKVDLPPPGTDGEMSAQSQMVRTATNEHRVDSAEGQPGLEQQTSAEGSYYPDTSQYQYDETSGFYYDSQTGLYYDPNSQYFYNAHTQQYMYWDGAQYVPAEHQAPVPNVGTPLPVEKEEKKKEKGKVAKKVASDMRRWAETMNEMKNVKSKKSGGDSKKDSSSATADCGFAVLSKRADPVETKQSVMLALKRSSTSEEQRSKMAKSSITNILAQYGGDTDSEEEEPEPPPKKKQQQQSTEEDAPRERAPSVPNSLTDWSKLICLLCKRQFPSKEVLVKHQQFSDLHKQNLEALKKRTGLQDDGDQQGDISYRDRAKERRSRFSYK